MSIKPNLKLLALYESAFNEILGSINAAKSSNSYWRKAKQAVLLRQVGEILDRFNASSKKELGAIFRKLAAIETELAIEDLERFTDALQHAEKWHLEFNEKYAAQACEDCFDHIAGQTQRMKRKIKQALREDSAEVFRLASVLGTSRAKAYRQLRDKILSKNPEFQFIDKAGRKWDSKTYFEMLTHTVMSTAQRDIYANTLTNEGIDLVKVVQNGAKDACKKWEGKIISLTGATKGYPTLQEATASGEIFHPRCRHRFVAYDPSIEDHFKQEAA